MTIVGFNLSKILVERDHSIKGGIKVNTRIDIKDIKKEDIAISQGKDVLGFAFEFEIIYKDSNSAKVASLLFEGSVLDLIDPKDTKKILESWKKKEIDDNIKINILNSILAKCNTKALVLEEDMNLPSHIPLPSFKPENKK